MSTSPTNRLGVCEGEEGGHSLRAATHAKLWLHLIMFASHRVLHLIKHFRLFRSDGDAKIGICGADFPFSTYVTSKTGVFKGAKFEPNSR
jgi:hypothetical protein